MANKYREESREAQARWRRWRSCERKRAFETRAAALQAGQKVYECEHCGRWHRSGSTAALAAKLRRMSGSG